MSMRSKTDGSIARTNINHKVNTCTATTTTRRPTHNLVPRIPGPIRKATSPRNKNPPPQYRLRNRRHLRHPLRPLQIHHQPHASPAHGITTRPTHALHKPARRLQFALSGLSLKTTHHGSQFKTRHESKEGRGKGRRCKRNKRSNRTLPPRLRHPDLPSLFATQLPHHPSRRALHKRRRNNPRQSHPHIPVPPTQRPNIQIRSFA